MLIEHPPTRVHPDDTGRGVGGCPIHLASTVKHCDHAHTTG